MTGFKRLIKATKIVNKQQLLMTRREPYRPLLAERHEIGNKAKLAKFEHDNEDGVVFVADRALPPWKRTIKTNVLAQQGIVQNFRGMRVRAVNKVDEPGFPTHFR